MDELIISYASGSGSTTCYSSSGRSDACSEDDWIVQPLLTGMRLAVIDGVTFTPQTPVSRPIDVAAAHPAGLVRTALKSYRPAADVIKEVNGTMFQAAEFVDVPRDRPQATCVVLDLVPPAPVQLLQAGDCMAWLKTGGVWRSAFPGDVHTSEYRRLERSARRAEQDHAAHLDATRSIPETIEHWWSTPLGRFPEARVRAIEVVDPDEVVLASDGALLSTEMMADLPEAMRSVWDRQRAARLPKKTDDVTVLHWRRD